MNKILVSSECSELLDIIAEIIAYDILTKMEKDNKEDSNV